MKDQWKKQMQQKMADYQESDIEVSWAELEKALAKNRQQAKVVPLWLRRVAAAAVILLIAGGGYWTLFHHRTEMEQQAGQTQMTSVSREQKSQEPDLKQDLQEKIIQTAVKAQRLLPLLTAVNDTKSDTLYTSTEVETESPADTVVFPKYTPSQQHYTVYPSDLRKRTSSSNRLTAKVYLSNTMASSSQFSSFSYLKEVDQNKEGHTSVEGNPGKDGSGKDGVDGKDGVNGKDGSDGKDNSDSENVTDKPNSGNTVGDDMTPVYRTVQASEHVHHHQPIRFGFSLRYRINRQWSLESGLTYTRLTADITNTDDGQSTTTEQSLNYIGIPLNVSYLMWGNRRFSFYLSAGGLVEKMVKGSRTSQGVANSVSIHPLQVSLNGAVGAEFKFSDDLSLYAEPALNYYFDNGSRIPTLYQEKPLNFNLNVGIRFNIK